MEEKLEEKIPTDDRMPENDRNEDELRAPIKLLEKVLELCRNDRCNSLNQLIKVTEDVLIEYDKRIIEKVKLTDAFDQLKLKLFGHSTIPTDNPIKIIASNSTETGIELDDGQYPTTTRYLKTSELIAEHKDIDGDDLEIEDDLSRNFKNS